MRILVGLVGLGLLASVAACQATAVAGDDVEAYEETAPTMWCGTHEPSENVKLATEREVARLPRREAVTGATIDVHVHVLRKGFGIDNGDVPDAAIQAQLGVLDRAYAAHGWRFRLVEIDRQTKPAWFTMRAGTPEEHNAKAALRRGDARALNIYTADPGNGVIGYATYPTDYKAAPQRDGVVIRYSTLPGLGDGAYALGDQLVHQVGHWLGLYHTFQEACSTDRGDFVDDTPPSSAPAFGCPVGRDTCGAAGDDPVRNYMDSTDDTCMNTFTPGQALRIKTQFDAFRRFE